MNKISKRRVLRGGAWSNFPNYLRSAYRNNYAATKRYNGFGLRLIQEEKSNEKTK